MLQSVKTTQSKKYSKNLLLHILKMGTVSVVHKHHCKWFFFLPNEEHKDCLMYTSDIFRTITMSFETFILEIEAQLKPIHKF